MGRYDEIFKIRSATDVIPSFGEIPTSNTDVYITYKSSDRLDLISNRIYGDPKYWWVILAANNYQIEFEIETGEILRVPYPLMDTIEYIRNKLDGTK